MVVRNYLTGKVMTVFSIRGVGPTIPDSVLIFLAICLSFFPFQSSLSRFSCLSPISPISPFNQHYFLLHVLYLVNKQGYTDTSTVQESAEQEIGDRNKRVFQED
jgi:hypothetical protein